jgi:hypothetical protein
VAGGPGLRFHLFKRHVSTVFSRSSTVKKKLSKINSRN